MTAGHARRLGFAVKVLGRKGMRSHDTRRWQSDPGLDVSLDALESVLDYMSEAGFDMYRLSSDFVPYATHPDMPQFHGQIDRHAGALERIGRRAREQDVRLSLHPSQYVVLNAADEEIAAKAAWDLEVQARLLDALGQGPEAVVVLHVGGAYGDPAAALDRFVRRVDHLSEPTRRRLVVENDELTYTVEDCLRIHQRTGLRIVFDHHHHRLNPGGLETVEAARAALGTWPPDVVPKIHFSSPRLDARQVQRGGKTRSKPPLLRQHADYIDPWTFAEFLEPLSDVPFDVMIEAKAKDLAVERLRDQLADLGLDHVLTTAAQAAGGRTD